MLTLTKKIDKFENLLLLKNNTYADEIKNEIYEYYFLIYGNKENINDFLFFNTYDTIQKIEEKTEFLISKIIMHEHQSGIHDLIQEYGF